MTLDLALSLAARGWYVFPVSATTRRPVVKWGDAATTDAEQVATWWTGDHLDALVGVHAGKSRLVVVDIDEKNGKSGSQALEQAGITSPDTFSYSTRSGGRHLLYAAPSDRDLTIAQNVPVDGVDIRAGVGFIVYNGPALDKDTPPELAPAPEWSLLDRKKQANSDDDATVTAWLDRTASGKPSKSVREALTAVTPDGMDRAAMLHAVTELIKLGAEPGAGDAYRQARRTYLEHYPDYAREWDNAAAGSVKRLGLPPITFDIPKPERKALKQRADPVKAIKRAAKVQPGHDRLAGLDELDPELFFDNKLGLLSMRLASAISGDIAIGLDGLCWEYRNGVWAPNDTAIETRTIHALGDRYRPSAAMTMRSVIMNGGDAPHLRDVPNGDYLNVLNGMLNWRTGALEPHDPAHLSTVQLSVAHDPAATAPYFEAWLRERVPADAYKTVLEVIGYLLMSGNPYQKAVLLYGPGSNGKSTLLRVIRAIAGDQNISGVTLRSMSEGKFETAGMFGKLLNIVGDIDSKYLNDASTFKAITGDDGIDAQHKFGRPFRFHAWAVPVFSANKMWASADTSDGYFRRWLTIPFPYEVEHDPTFSEARFLDELPGILNLAVAGLQRLAKRGRFKEPQSIRDLLAEFRSAADVVATWLDDDERVVKHDEESDGRESRHTLYVRFRTWATDNGYGNMSSATFYERLRGLKYHEVKSNGVRMFHGLSVRGAVDLGNVTNLHRGARADGDRLA